MTHATELDLGPLTWVKSEIDQALARADEALGKAQGAAGDAGSIQFAQTHLHQARGALSIVGLDGLTHFALSLDQLLGALARGEVRQPDQGIDVARRALAAIGNYLEELVTGTPDQPLRLASLYAEVVGACNNGETKAAPADLFFPDLSRRPPRRAPRDPRPNAAWEGKLRAVRTRFERGLLHWLQHPTAPTGPEAMREAVADLEAVHPSVTQGTLWWAAQGFLDGLQQGVLPATPEIKQICAMLHREIRQLPATSQALPEKLVRNLLYWIAQVPAHTERQKAVRKFWQLDALLPEEGTGVTEIPLAPLLKKLQADLAGAKNNWDLFCSGQAAALQRFAGNLKDLSNAAQPLGRPALHRLLKGINTFVVWLRKDPLQFNNVAALEVAGALLLCENALGKGALERNFTAQVNDTLSRLGALIRGERLQAAEHSITIEAARRAQEKEAQKQVAKEVLSNLAQVEQALDDFFRNQDKRAPLGSLEAPLKQIQGALALIGDEQAINLVREATSLINQLADGSREPEQQAFEQLAQRLSALGFYVEALKHGPADLERFLNPEPIRAIDAPAETEADEDFVVAFSSADNLMVDDDASSDTEAETRAGTRSAATAKDVAPPPTAQPAPQPAATAAPAEPAKPAPAAPAPAASEAPHEELDAELLEIFLEEAHEVLATIADELGALRNASTLDHLTAIRRGFHTLKGSGRMVGLTELGEAAWSIEQTLNRWLQLEWMPTAALFALIEEAHQVFSEWATQIENGGGHGRDVDAMVAHSERLRDLENPQADTSAAPAAMAAATPAAVAPDTAEETPDDESELEKTQFWSFDAARHADDHDQFVETDLLLTLPNDNDDGPYEVDRSLEETVLDTPDMLDPFMPQDFSGLGADDSAEENIELVALDDELEAEQPPIARAAAEPDAAEPVQPAIEATPPNEALDAVESFAETVAAPVAETAAWPEAEAAPADATEVPSVVEPVLSPTPVPDAFAAATLTENADVPTFDFGDLPTLDLAPTTTTTAIEAAPAVEDLDALPLELPTVEEALADDAFAPTVESETGSEDEDAEAAESLATVTAFDAPQVPAVAADETALPDDAYEIAVDIPAEEPLALAETEAVLTVAPLDAHTDDELPAELAISPAETVTLAQPAFDGTNDFDTDTDADSGIIADSSAPVAEADVPAAADTSTLDADAFDIATVESPTSSALDIPFERPEATGFPESADAAEPIETIAPTEAAEATDADADHQYDIEVDAGDTGDTPDTTAAPAKTIAAAEVAAPIAPPPEPTTVRVGDVEVSRALFELYVGEARQHIAHLHEDIEHLLRNPTLVPSERAQRAAHTLAGISGTARLDPPHELARALEHALARVRNLEQPPTAEQSELLAATTNALEAMLAEISAFNMPLHLPELEAQLEAVGTVIALEDLPFGDDGDDPALTAAYEAAQAITQDVQQEVAAEAVAEDNAPAIHDDVDDQLLPIFLEEATELLGQLHATLRTWQAGDGDTAAHAHATARLLHTMKGSARMTGAMTLGEHVHQMETRLEAANLSGEHGDELIEALEVGLDQAERMIVALTAPEAAEPAAAPLAANVAAPAGATMAIAPEFDAPLDIASANATLRVRADTIDRFVNEAGEIGIARTRIEGELRTVRRSLLDLTENVIRLRNQLREVEIQAEVQMQSRISQSETEHTEFDLLEMDRFTRLQELTRMMAESVGDVTTVQQNLLKNLDGAELALQSQARLSRDLQQALMQVRMVPFDSLADRLHRVVRQSAKDLGKRANLDIRGGRIEVDRSVLERMTAPLEHLLRNAIAHGIETSDVRQRAGKGEIGQISLSISQEGNEIAIVLADDGAGLNYAAIAQRARERELLGPDEQPDQRRLANLIFLPGFSTAANVSAVSGRGVGMDVVKSETAAVGGRVDIQPGAETGTEFHIHLPLTLAVTQALLVRAAGRTYAIPSSLISQVLELRGDALENLRSDGGTEWQDVRYHYRYLPHLLGDAQAQYETQRFNWVLLLRTGSQALALHVDALRGNQEIVVKNAGPQLVRIVGISGATVLGDGEIVLILNPVALASRSLLSEQRGGETAAAASEAAPVQREAVAPTIMIVDDSLTVRKITGRLLEREGYTVLTAKDGADALEKLIETVPDVILSDIEMPRMDGFDLLRNIRADDRTKAVPVIMITSRLADKHRQYAEKIGANHYLGKPFEEEELLGLLQSYTGHQSERATALT